MNILELSNVSKKISGKKILDNVSFDLKRGEIIGLVGANGAGKTTLMKTILKLIDKNEGVINYNLNSKKDIGALIESPGIYPFLSGYDNLKLFSENKDDKQIKEIITKLKMENYIQKKAKYYSLGMKQKLGIAFALLNEPELVVLDEPMNGLDPRAVRDVRNIIDDMSNSGTTFLISSHILSELLKVTDTIVIIDHGKIVKVASVKDIQSLDKHEIEDLLLDIIDGKEIKN